VEDTCAVDAGASRVHRGATGAHRHVSESSKAGFLARTRPPGAANLSRSGLRRALPEAGDTRRGRDRMHARTRWAPRSCSRSSIAFSRRTSRKAARNKPQTISCQAGARAMFLAGRDAAHKHAKGRAPVAAPSSRRPHLPRISRTGEPPDAFPRQTVQSGREPRDAGFRPELGCPRPSGPSAASGSVTRRCADPSSAPSPGAFQRREIPRGLMGLDPVSLRPGECRRGRR
jgi:hypothetical protein